MFYVPVAIIQNSLILFLFQEVKVPSRDNISGFCWIQKLLSASKTRSSMAAGVNQAANTLTARPLSC